MVLPQSICQFVGDETLCCDCEMRPGCSIHWWNKPWRSDLASRKAKSPCPPAPFPVRNLMLKSLSCACSREIWQRPNCPKPHNPRPHTLNPKPHNPRPHTLNPKPHTLNPKPSTPETRSSDACPFTSKRRGARCNPHNCIDLPAKTLNRAVRV